jgi:hypothetical protein
LIELIVFIIIGAIFLPLSMVAFTSVMNDYSRPDYYAKAKYYADKRMAQITNNQYDSVTSSLCPAAPTPEAAPDDGYTTECTIGPINRDDLSTTTIPLSPYYKRITVTVRYSGLSDDYIISTIITRRPKLP